MLVEIKSSTVVLRRSRPTDKNEADIQVELDLAARMAAQSASSCCGKPGGEGRPRQLRAALAKRAVDELQRIGREFAPVFWPARNKATPKKCAQFLRWRRKITGAVVWKVAC